jgi:hypothetical protein
MNKLFYIIYNAYYKHGEYKNDIPSLTVGGIFSIFFFSIGYSSLIIIKLINDPFFLHLPKLSKPIMSLITILFGIIVYFIFYYGKKYQKIYETYKEDVFLNSKLAKGLGFFFVFLIILSPLIIGLIRNKIYFSYWV